MRIVECLSDGWHYIDGTEPVYPCPVKGGYYEVAGGVDAYGIHFLILAEFAPDKFWQADQFREIIFPESLATQIEECLERELVHADKI